MQAQLEKAKSLVEILVRPSSNPLGKNNPAFILHRGGEEREVNYDALDHLTSQAEVLLRSINVGIGDKIVLISPNSPELFATMLAGFRVGAIVCPVDFRMTAVELVNIAKRIGIKAVVTERRLMKEIDKIEADLKDTDIKIVDLADVVKQDKEAAIKSSLVDYKSLKDPAFLILTSGTTGMPKGALHDLESLVLNIDELAQMAELTQGFKVVLPVPLSHVLGLEVTLAALLSGCTVIMSDMTIEGIIASNNKFKPEFLVGVPTIYGAMLSLDKTQVDFSSAKVLLCGGAPLTASLADQFETKHGKRLNNGYGSTESKIIAVNLSGPIESVGKIVPSCTIKILDGQGKELPDGEEGEIVICGPMLMLGYIGQTDETGKVIEGTCYHTGDIGHMDKGYLFISGRAKEMINVAGNKVFPAEVEGALKNCPLVKEVAVIGVENSKLGQIVKAHIVTTDESLSNDLKHESTAKAAKATLKEKLREFCGQNLKRELRPMEWVFYPADHVLPRTLSGKIDKKQLS